MKVCGIDEAGRGPVLGPMVIACAVFDNKGKQKLRKLKVRDSKRISAKKRRELEDKIKEIALEWNLIKLYPQDIDRLRKKFSLNLVEAIHISELILSLNCKPDKIILDSPDSVEENFKGKIIGYLLAHDYEIPQVISENKADDKYIEVGAASILAKVERDREIEMLREKFGVCGSGYPSDELTRDFLRNLINKNNASDELPDFVRKSWNTIKKKQKRLMDYQK
jgi:ribonuclease HII